MKFTMQNGEMLEDKTIGQKLLDEYNEFADYVIGGQIEFILKPIGNGIVEVFSKTCDVITIVMPDIGFVMTVAAGLAIMMTGKATKPLMYWSGGMTFAIIWLANAVS